MSEMDKTSSMHEIETAQKVLKKEIYLKRILGKSKVIREVRQRIDQISSCIEGPSILITGESGTGKELVARTVHYLSDRNEKPFIPVNCSAIPESIFESEFFGHVKGAFTGADISQKGLIEEADGGTIFLDEISTVRPYIQAKFLRLLQEGEYKRLGDSKIRNADIRVIAATNKDLIQMFKDETFREDLFYRLNTIPIYIPPLRDRKVDIPILIGHFTAQYSRRYKKAGKELSEEAMRYLVSYQWPGNIRELENIVQQFVIMCDSSTITASDVIFLLNGSDSSTENLQIESMKDAKKQYEKTYLINLMKTCNGNVVYAAKRAGLSRTALWNHFRKHDISPQQFRTQR